MVNCVVAGCTKRTGDNVSFFRFSNSDTKEYKLWVKLLNRAADANSPASGKLWEPYRTSVICSDHLADHCLSKRPSVLKSIGFYDFQRLRLEKGAMPSIFPKKVDSQSCQLGLAVQNKKAEPRSAFAKRERQRVSI
jgi:hypothetical protein